MVDDFLEVERALLSGLPPCVSHATPRTGGSLTKDNTH